MKNIHIHIEGQVQGVGFRPYVFRLANEFKLTGWVCNSVDGVHIEVHGKTRQLDEFAKEKKWSKIDVVKIDVEGHEFDTIKGCKEILKAIKPVFIIEIELRHAHYPIKDIFDFIIGFGYEVFYFDRKTLKTVLFDYNQMADFQKDAYLNDFNLYINNFIFVPKD